VARKYVFTRFKTLKDLSVVAVEGELRDRLVKKKPQIGFWH
jgi:hypothetical protein